MTRGGCSYKTVLEECRPIIEKIEKDEQISNDEFNSFMEKFRVFKRISYVKMHFQYHKYHTAGIKIIFWKKRIIEIYDLSDKLITGVSNQDRLDREKKRRK